MIRICRAAFAAILGVGLGMFVAISGCAAQKAAKSPVEVVVSPAATQSAEEPLVQRDPIAYLRHVAAKCARLEQYSLTFTRQERRGIGFFKSLRDPERIACRFRQDPFSIYMNWLDPDIKYGESTYVAGEEDNKVRFVPRHGLFGLPPTVTRVDLQTPVIWGEARYPLSEFGLKRMMERTLANIERANGQYEVVYKGVVRLTGSGRRAHSLWFEFHAPDFDAPIREVFIDVETELPTCTRIIRESGALEAAYFWDDVDPSVTFTDEDFLLDAERKKRER